MKTGRKHPILGNPYAAMILLMVYGFAMTSISSGAEIVLRLLGMDDSLSGEVWSVVIVLVGFLMLAIHKCWFKPEFQGDFQTDFLKNKSVMACIIAFLGIDLVLHLVDYTVYGCTGFSFSTLLEALAAGCSEEVICRGLVISAMMRSLKDKKSFMPALIFPALLFGLSHLALALDGGDTSGTVLTVVSASLAGLFFGALYLRTGSILPSVILHSLHDFIAMMINTDSTAADTVYEIMYGILLIALFVLTVILMKGHKADVFAMWQERWSGGRDSQQETAE